MVRVETRDPISSQTHPILPPQKKEEFWEEYERILGGIREEK